MCVWEAKNNKRARTRAHTQTQHTHRLGVRDQKSVLLLEVAEDGEQDVERDVGEHGVQHGRRVGGELAGAEVRVRGGEDAFFFRVCVLMGGKTARSAAEKKVRTTREREISVPQL